MNFKPIMLEEEFEGRDQELERIERYKDNKHFLTMYYRTNDLIHSKRVLYHLEEAIPKINSIYGDFDVNYSRTLALVHDDVEIIPEIGDVMLYVKDNMTDEERQEMEDREIEAIQKVVNMFSDTVNGFDYQKLLFDAKKKISLESRFVSFFDKFDGAGEAWHEVWAGNKSFVWPANVYQGRLNKFPDKYHNMKPFFEKFPEYLPETFDFEYVVEEGEFHTRSNIKKESGFDLYDRWKDNIIRNEGFDNLINIVEFDR